MHLSTLSSWVTLLMCMALALLVIWFCHYKPRHRALECARCETQFTSPPIFDVESWLPADLQAVYCSDECLEGASERYWMGVWSDQS